MGTLNFTLTRINEVFPNFNTKPITEFDFWRAAKQEQVVVRSMPLMVDGYYQRKGDRHYILINSDLGGTKWLHTALHEFCHYLFHEPGAGGEALYRKGCGDITDPRERFADAFALVGLLPFPDLLELQTEDLSENLMLSQLVAGRIMARTEYGI